MLPRYPSSCACTPILFHFNPYYWWSSFLIVYPTVGCRSPKGTPRVWITTIIDQHILRSMFMVGYGRIMIMSSLLALSMVYPKFDGWSMLINEYIIHVDHDIFISFHWYVPSKNGNTCGVKSRQGPRAFPLIFPGRHRWLHWRFVGPCGWTCSSQLSGMEGLFCQGLRGKGFFTLWSWHSMSYQRKSKKYPTALSDMTSLTSWELEVYW